MVAPPSELHFFFLADVPAMTNLPLLLRPLDPCPKQHATYPAVRTTNTTDDSDLREHDHAGLVLTPCAVAAFSTRRHRRIVFFVRYHNVLVVFLGVSST